MHLANLSAARNWLSVARTPLGVPPGASRAHALRADWNAGDRGLIPMSARLIPPPLAPGSGKLGTRCARMHRANSSACELAREPAALLGVCEDPQAAIATAQLTATRLARMVRLPGAPNVWHVVRGGS
jgi:hypothetical protein